MTQKIKHFPSTVYQDTWYHNYQQKQYDMSVEKQDNLGPWTPSPIHTYGVEI